MSKKTPQIRFKGFTDDWEERKFKDNIVSIQTGTNLLGSAVNEGTPLIKMGNLQRGYFSFKKLEYLDSNSNVGSEDIVNYGDFLFNTRNTLELVGKGATWTGISGKYAFNSNIARFKFDGIDTIFFNYLYNTQQVISQVHARAVGTTSVSAVYPRDLNSLLYYLPSIEEQQKIGSFFKHLDDTIALHQRKLDLLKEQKKGFLQKMFPKNGAKVPELRFSGFADDWEERKLEKVFDTITDYVANGSFESLRKNVNSSDINGFAYLVRLQDASNNWQGPWLYTDQHGYEFLKKSRLQPDDIIMANVGSVGKFFLVPKLDKPMTLAPNAVLIKSSENDQGFLYQMMLTPEMQYKIFEKTTPGVQSKINKTDFKMIETRLPNMDEQKKIGAFFKQLDDTIALHQRKLDLLKEQKKGFLQKMFVS
ncbi:restriction endonuclease subunit S [Leuconostoc citreum]|uniref:restriction endonuclease subunit S n=1 Tax=Leuconostoc citreum TaxID=33964 RepID=UPI0021A2BB85|nr:restriction endonuclease subunit S [Leuconostoc citreum]MCT3058897.1 restriction endonuclease subunit S [Leuconostoc citreum]